MIVFPDFPTFAQSFSILNFYLLYQGIRYSADELKSPGLLHPAFVFCRQWLLGQDSFLFSTSGSTGSPRKITLTRKQLTDSAHRTASVFLPRSGDMQLLCLSTETVGGIMMLVRSLVWDIPIHVTEPRSNPFSDGFVYQGETLVSLVPLQLKTIATDLPSVNQLNKFRIVLLGGAAADAQAETIARGLSPLVYHGYGMTETASHVALRKLNPIKEPAYTPLNPVKIYLSSENQLCIQLPEESPIITNDIGEVFPDGRFRILGRADFVINSGGLKIQPEETEEVMGKFMLDNQLLHRYFAWGLPDPLLGEKLVLFVEGDAKKFPTQSCLSFLKENCPRHKAPKEIIFAPEFILTASGKINKPETSRHSIHGKK